MPSDSQKPRSRRTILSAIAAVSGVMAIVRSPIGETSASESDTQVAAYVASIFRDDPADHSYLNEIRVYNPAANDDAISEHVVTRLKRVEPKKRAVLHEAIELEPEPGETKTETIEVEDLSPGEYLAETVSSGVVHDDTFVIPEEDEE